ncbi:non-ribosomal peptide synthetase [Pontiella sulfatireligans]|nr:amino acid adenylation domain-containing protein [Pontiella sulfatireligans]
MEHEINTLFWKGIYAGFEEATPLAFGYDDVPQLCSDWKIVAPTSSVSEALGAGWVLLLSRYSGESDISIGVKRSEDSAPRPLRLSVDESLTSSQFIQSISTQLEEQEGHPAREENLRQLLGVPAGQVLFKSAIFQSPEHEIEIRGAGGFSAETLSQVSSHLERLLAALSENGSAIVRELSFLKADERDTLIRSWNPAPTPYPEATMQALFERQVAERPDAAALVFESQEVTYKELNVRANRLAHYLTATGIKPGQGVAVFLERGVEQIVAFLAILKAGAAYIPLDAGSPAERLSQMLEDAEPAAILTHSVQGGRVTDSCDAPMVFLDSVGNSLQTLPVGNPSSGECSPDSLAYVMYTSGSTGRPKGVEVVHRGIVRLLFGVDYIPFGSDTVILHMASASFDASTFEIWGALLHGGTCVLCAERIPTLETIGRLLVSNRVNTFWMTAALFNLAVAASPEILAPVEYLLAGGEALSPWHVKKALRELPNLRLVNGYGPTENTTFSTTYAFDRNSFDPAKPIPIGRPIGNSTCYVLDRFLRPLPVGVPGELYVGGDGVARGYANRPDLTAERFLDDPFSVKPGARMYKTGDLVYWNKDGTIGFIGRVDNQIKLRGYRIELQDIDVALSSFAGVEQAVTVLYEDDVRGKWLAGFVKVEDPETFPLADLEKFAYEKLPDYMVPSVLVPVAEWSYTPSGKLDRKSLPKPAARMPGFSSGDTNYRSTTESRLAEILKVLLGLEVVPRDISFFELGGDSLRAVTLFLRIQQNFGKDFPLATLANASSIAELAQLIDGGGEGDSPDLSRYRSLQILQRGNEGEIPLVLVHGGAGNVLIFSEFISNLGERHPVYAFQWSGWDGQPGETTIAEMAEVYRRELLAFNPQESYHMGGHCIGGLIAIEMAHRLREKGIGIEGPIIVSDCPNLNSVKYRSFEPALAPATYEAYGQMVRDLHTRALEGQSAGSLPEHSAPGLVEWIKSIPLMVLLVRTGRLLPNLVRIQLDLVRGRKVSIEHRPLHAMVCLVRAAKGYRPNAYQGDVLYFRSHCSLGREMSLSGWWDDCFMGFGELCEGHFEGHVVGGGHNDPLNHPVVAEIAKKHLDKHKSKQENASL